MPSPEKITSAQNPKIKNLKKLEKSSERHEHGLIVIEGIREIMLAKQKDYHITALFVCEEIFDLKKKENLVFINNDGKHYRLDEDTGQGVPVVYQMSKEVYETVAYRGSTEGIIATAKPKTHLLKNLQFDTEAPLILVIEAVEKPGNLGAMLRTSDAASVDAVIICDAKTDVYNPNVIRSSVGTVFTNQIAVCESKAAIEFLKENKITICAAQMEPIKWHYKHDFKKASAIVMGTEATGLSKLWIDGADEKINIPMQGYIDSLNVSVAAGILLFEAVRQRHAQMAENN